MLKTTLTLAAVITLATLLPSAAQERVKPKKAASVPEILAQATSAFGEARYGACLREATGLVAVERAKVIRASLPAAPKGMEKVDEQGSTDTDAANPFAAALLGGIGSVVTQEYRGEERQVSVTVTADSPLVQMFSMWVTNPALLEKGSELVKYGAYSAVLKTEPNKELELMILIDKTVVDVKSSGLSDDELLAFIDQKAVDALAAVLAK
jgi:hypothetical protein